MPTDFYLRLATERDIPQLHTLITRSVRELMAWAYSAAQLEASLGNWLGLDTQLIVDGTYFVVEHAGDSGEPVPVGCGGWSKRKTPYGSDHRVGREDALLDPATAAAKIRAFFVHPEWARRGIGVMLLEASEAAAIQAGFTRLEMGATLSGVPFYRKHGYADGEKVDLPLGNGDVLPILTMFKRVS